MSASKRAQQGGLTVVKMVGILNMPRQTLYDIFNRDKSKFDDLLFKAMRLKCERDIELISGCITKRLNESLTQDK